MSLKVGVLQAQIATARMQPETRKRGNEVHATFQLLRGKAMFEVAQRVEMRALLLVGG